jgi:hypothetical protein
MKQAIKTEVDIRTILIDLLQSIQKTNELMVKFALVQKNAAKYCGYSESYMYQFASRMEIPVHKPMGKKGRLFFKRGELEDALSRGKQDIGYELTEKRWKLKENRSATYLEARCQGGLCFRYRLFFDREECRLRRQDIV